MKIRFCGSWLVAWITTVIVTLGVSACGGKSTTDLVATVRDSTANTSQRCEAATELGKRKVKAAVGDLNKVMAVYGGHDSFDLDQWMLAGCVAHALGAIGDPTAVRPILKAWGAVEDWPTQQQNIEQNDLFRDKARDALVAIGALAVPQLISIVAKSNALLLKDSRGDYQPGEDYPNAIEVLGQVGDRRAEPALVNALKAGPHLALAYHVAAGKALAAMYRNDVKHLLPLLRSAETFEIAYGIIALGKAGTEPALRDALLRFGDEMMAEEYLNCGNPKLEAASHEWAKANGYAQNPIPQFGAEAPKTWGSLK